MNLKLFEKIGDKYEFVESISAVGLILTLIVFVWMFVSLAFDSPLVHKSWSTKKCLFIETPNGNLSCSKIDKIGGYEIVWHE